MPTNKSYFRDNRLVHGWEFLSTPGFGTSMSAYCILGLKVVLMGWAVRPVMQYMSWVYNVERQLVPYSIIRWLLVIVPYYERISYLNIHLVLVLVCQGCSCYSMLRLVLMIYWYYFINSSNSWYSWYFMYVLGFVLDSRYLLLWNT